jgi:hypothetical protein
VSKTIEDLQRIVSDESRTEEERRQAAEHILKLQPPSLTDKEEREKQEIRNIFKAMRLSHEEIEEDTDKRIAKENTIRKVCPTCYRRQPIGNAVCELCGHEPTAWLLSEERRPRQNRIGDIIDNDGHVIATGKAIGGHLKAHAAKSWLRWAATSASVDELKYIVSTFSGSDDGWRIKHAAAVLRLRGETVPKTFWGEEVSTQIDPRPLIEGTVPAPVDVTEIDFDGLIKRCDREIAAITSQQAEAISQ